MQTNVLEPSTSRPEAGTVAPRPSGSSRINVGTNERILSAVGGLLVGYLGLRGRTNWLVTLAGGALMYRGLSGNCPVNTAIGRDSTAEQAAKPLSVKHTLTIRKPKEELYAYWRQLENLPRFMHHLQEVKQLDAKRSFWKAHVPTGVASVEWEAEIVQEEANHRIAWRSVPGSTVDNSGEVVFTDAPNGRGTEVRATILYRPPAGAIGAVVGKLLNFLTEGMVKEDLRRFKQLMETGEATVTGIQAAKADARKDKPAAGQDPEAPRGGFERPAAHTPEPAFGTEPAGRGTDEFPLGGEGRG